MSRALYPEFDIAVLRLSHILMPHGFDIRDDAPDTYEKLQAHYLKTGRVCVWSGASDKTIFETAALNHHFRAWHDYRHLTTHNDFSLAGEMNVAFAQQNDIKSLNGTLYASLPAPVVLENDLTYKLGRIVWAEVVGQALYRERYNGWFPKDQRGFTEAFVNQGEGVALSREW